MAEADMAPPKSSNTETEGEDEFDWIRIKAKVEQTKVADVGVNRLNRLMRDNPFVPIGCASTVAALLLGLRSFRRGESRNQQLMMRARVGAQGFTLVALIGGVFYQAYKDV